MITEGKILCYSFILLMSLLIALGRDPQKHDRTRADMGVIFKECSQEKLIKIETGKESITGRVSSVIPTSV